MGTHATSKMFMWYCGSGSQSNRAVFSKTKVHVLTNKETDCFGYRCGIPSSEEEGKKIGLDLSISYLTAGIPLG